jgi:hypothetical protein
MFEMFDRMDCIGKAALGLSFQCGQCHDHKFDRFPRTRPTACSHLSNTYELNRGCTRRTAAAVDKIHANVRAAEER